MKLSLDRGYMDYNDHAHFDPVLSELIALTDGYSMQIARQQTTEDYLCTMERFEELIRYYGATGRFDKLEEAMRKYEPLLTLGKDKGIEEAGFDYLCFTYERLNGLLYANSNQFQHAARYYRNAAEIAKMCMEKTVRDASLLPYQRQFLFYYIQECLHDYSVALDHIGDPEGAYAVLAESEQALLGLSGHLEEDDLGLINQLAFSFTDLVAEHFTHGNFEGSRRCAEEGKRVCRIACGNDYFDALALYVDLMYAYHVGMATQNLDLLDQVKKKAEALLPAEYDERAEAVLMMIVGSSSMMESSVLFMAGKNEEGYAASRKAVDYNGKAYDLMKKCCEENLQALILLRYPLLRLLVSYTGAMETYAFTSYNMDQRNEAASCFRKVLSLLDDSGVEGIRIGESASRLLRAESAMFLGLMNYEDNQVEKAEFYAMQAADICVDAAVPNFWPIGIKAATMVAEACLLYKNKTRALEYAEKGLTMCDRLAAANPQADELTLRGSLEKFKKKASKKGLFW